MAFACMFEQPRVAVQGNLHNWHLNKHIWSLNLNPWFKPTSFNMIASCISSINSIAMTLSCIFEQLKSAVYNNLN